MFYTQRLKVMVASLLWIYIILRAYYLGITHDEAYAYFLVKTNYINALAGTANTHWLNSLGMKTGLIFSEHPFFLRLFSIGAWAVYAYSAIRISYLINQPVISFFLFSLLVLNPFLIDFFSLARGYGLMCAFLLLALYHAATALQAPQPALKHWWPSFVYAALSVASNYTALYFFIVLTTFFGLYLLQHRQLRPGYPPLNSRRWWFLLGGTCSMAVANLLFIKLYTGDLEEGGDRLFSSLFVSLVRGTAYGADERWVQLFSYLLLAGVCAALLYILVLFTRTKALQPLVLFGFIPAGILLLNVVFHWLFSTPFLYGRTALILYPVFVCPICFTIAEVPLFRKYAIGIITAAAGTLLLLFHFSNTLNLSYCFEWKKLAETKQVLDRIIRENPKKVLVYEWHGGALINYYRNLRNSPYRFAFTGITTNEQVKLDSAVLKRAAACDYALLMPPVSFKAFAQHGIHMQVLAQYPVTGAMVLRIKKYK